MSTQPVSTGEADVSTGIMVDVGDYVIDTEDDTDDPDIGRVINLPGAVAANWDAYEDEDGTQLTVEDTNPDYDPEEQVVVCLYLSQLEEHYPSWDGDEPLSLSRVTDDGVTHYAFPRSRLEIGDPESLIPRPTELEELASELSSGANVDIEHTESGYELHIEKLGVEYQISEEGVVTGDGPHADAFQEKADAIFD